MSTSQPRDSPTPHSNDKREHKTHRQETTVMLSWWLFRPLDNPQPGLRGASACLWQERSVPLLLSWTLSRLKTYSLTWCLYSTAHKLRVTPQVWSPQHPSTLTRFLDSKPLHPTLHLYVLIRSYVSFWRETEMLFCQRQRLPLSTHTCLQN